jgi:uncharacterized protein YqjF (DUF2071 family)
MPWPLRDAELEVELDTMLEASGVVSEARAPFLRFVERLDVVAWSLERL